METAISVTGLNKSFGSLRAVENLSFSVSSGEVFGLLGTNGAGKTTTIECVLGTKRADSGKVSILGMDPQKDRKRLFQAVGVQFQEGAYQDRIAVRELCEVTQSLYARPADCRKLLGQLGLSDKEKSAVSDLSGGQRQRLFIVLALIPNPRVVFLDELTTGLDARARRAIWKYLAEMKRKGLAVLLTSHFMDEVEALCDHLLILKNGRSVFSGTVQEAVSASPYDRFEDAYLWFTGEEDTIHEDI
ncbi:MAG: ABC transporter ATP-binding protein [Eubacteriales bacterium]|nr:ABC transporter ATP-binding protein [Christensenellaceae bacterium]MEA5065594.1 ABC transporter ATP-binding protein [Eubacteriales bacterium]